MQMPTSPFHRRTLRFNSLEEIVPDVENLLAEHHTIGKWSLAQICNHLSDAINLSIDGFPHGGPWFIRSTIGPFIFRGIVKSGRMPRGVKLPEKYAPRSGLDATTEKKALAQAIERFVAYDGVMAKHPIGGAITKKMWADFHCVHCAHHLSFALPGKPL